MSTHSTQNTPPVLELPNAYNSQVMASQATPIRPSPVRMEFLEHPKAPLFSAKQKDRHEILEQALTAITSRTLKTQDDIREVLRQASLTSLWFFLRGVASVYGPYDKLTDHIHVSMSNFYQRQMRPTAHSGGFVPRSYYKSTIWTHGANTWEILRDPDITIGLVSGIADRAESFMRLTMSTFESNPMFAWLFPEFVVRNPASQTDWTRQGFVTPARSKKLQDMTIKPMTAGGSTAGIHVKLLKVDDIVSDAQLQADRSASADMERMGNWLYSNMYTLLAEPLVDRVFVVGTRYAINDPYEQIFADMRSIQGAHYAIPHKPHKNGLWDVYYRMVEEQGVDTFPESITSAEVARMDEWTRLLQYYNNPYLYDKAEINNYTIHECTLHMSKNRSCVNYIDRDGLEHTSTLDSMDIIQAVDPAATASGSRINKKRSRNAHVVIAKDLNGNYFILRGNVGQKEIYVVYDWIFSALSAFTPWLRMTGVEMSGPFKVLHRLIQREEQKRKANLHLRQIKTQGDKDARIRAFLEAPLREHKLYAVDCEFTTELKSELELFPNTFMKDCLDVLSMGIQELRDPKSALDYEFEEVQTVNRHIYTNRVTGY